MIELPIALAVISVFAMVQISLFRALPMGAKKYLAYNPALAILVNIFGSFFILTFTGTTYFVGPMNLIASIFFAFYVVGFKKFRKITKVKRGRLKFAGLKCGYTKDHWLF